MSAIVYGAVKQRGPKAGPLHHTLMVLADESDDFGFACPSVESIAHGSRCSERQAMRRLQRLEKDGWIRVQRKVFRGEMANAYFINLDRLGVVPTGKSRRSPLWTNVQRLLRALESRDKVSLLNGVLKFEKTPESVDLPENGDLFPDNSAGDILSPENEPETELTSAELRVSGQIAAKAVEKLPKSGETDDSAGDKVSRDKCHPRHLTSDIQGQPFNSLTRYYPVTERPPLPPQGGAELGLEDFSSWSLLRTRLKSELASVPAGVASRFGTVKPGESDYDACFRDWWLSGRRDEAKRVVLVTGASDPETTRTGVAKYASRLDALARSVFRGVNGRKVVVEVEAEPARVDLAASAEEPGSPGT